MPAHSTTGHAPRRETRTEPRRTPMRQPAPQVEAGGWGGLLEQILAPVQVRAASLVNAPKTGEGAPAGEVSAGLRQEWAGRLE